MAIGVADSAIFADMFGTPAMRGVFGDHAFMARCVEVEAALARAQGRLGIIPAEAVFIDNRADNVRGAQELGITGHVFTDAGTLRAFLESLLH